MDWKTAVEVMQVLGLRSICTFNDHRERLVSFRMYGKGSARSDKLGL